MWEQPWPPTDCSGASSKGVSPPTIWRSSGGLTIGIVVVPCTTPEGAPKLLIAIQRYRIRFDVLGVRVAWLWLVLLLLHHLLLLVLLLDWRGPMRYCVKRRRLYYGKLEWLNGYHFYLFFSPVWSWCL